jgi:RND family efflux transporter MFP subunit
VDVGDELEQGQLVAQLDPRDFENALSRAEAAKTQADALLSRVQEAAREGAVSRQDLTDAEARAATAAATVRIRRKSLEDASLLAPFQGTVAAIYIENFQNVVAKQTIVRLLDTSRIEMEVSVPENLIGLVPIAYGIEVEFDAYPGRKIPATINEVGNEASRATRTYPVTVVMDPPDDMNIKPGMAGKLTAQADLPTGAQGGIEIPLAALFSPPDDPEKRSFVWIVDPQGSTVARREVSVQRMTPRGALVAGLEAGQRVVTVGVHHLREGQQVSLLD